MGDNIFLGDRNGVRTPMQWSPDRNAGFSRADPQRLYLPPIMDPVYGYAAVNVEAQSRSTASLLNWTKRLIAARKAHPALSRGRCASSGRAIARCSRTCVNTTAKRSCASPTSRARVNRSSSTCREFKGRVPLELLGNTAFPPIGDLPVLAHAAAVGLLLVLAQPPTPITRSGTPSVRCPPSFPVLVIPEGLMAALSCRDATRDRTCARCWHAASASSSSARCCRSSFRSNAGSRAKGRVDRASAALLEQDEWIRRAAAGCWRWSRSTSPAAAATPTRCRWRWRGSKAMASA